MKSKNNYTSKLLVLLALSSCIVIMTALWANAEGYFSPSQPSSKTPKVNKETATHNAQRVFKAITTDSKVVKAELKERVPGQQLLWEIRSDQDSEVWVNANDGTTRFVFNGKGVTDAIDHVKSHQPIVSQDNALASAKAITKDFQLTLPDTAPTEKELFKDSEGDGGISQWKFKWAREKQGYKYHNDWVLVITDAYKSQLIAYNMNYSSKEPASLDVNIKKQKAAELAEQVAAKKNFNLKAKDSELVIVNPNYRWTDNFIKDTVETKLAWVVPFDKDNGTGEIWVDAATGEMLGGEETR